MLRKISISAIALASFNIANAQDSANTKSNLAISGYVDVYYRYNFYNSKKSEDFNNYTSFTNSQNSFELGMASVKLEHSAGKVGLVADVGFGKRAEDFSYADDKTKFIIKQAFLTYNPWQNVKLTAGSWATHVGYELVDAYANRNYSMSYMFSKGPFFHTGVKAEATFGKSGLMLGIANPTDLKSANFSHKFLIAQYSLAMADSKVKAYLNYQGGQPSDIAKLKQFDLTITGTVTDKFSLGYNGTVASIKTMENNKFSNASSWWGSAVYANFDPASWLGFTLRSEYFSDDQVLTDVFAKTEKGGSVFATTLSANFRVNNFTVIPEIRLDNASENIFTKHSGTPVKNTATALIAAVYKF